jgi:hypothetical protein
VRPAIISEPVLLVPAHVTAWLGLLTEAATREARRDSVTLPPDVVETLDKMRLMGDEWRQNTRTVPGVPLRDSPRAVVIESVSVKDATKLLGIKERGVRALCHRGTLHAEQRGNHSWRICTDSVTARLIGEKCKH